MGNNLKAIKCRLSRPASVWQLVRQLTKFLQDVSGLKQNVPSTRHQNSVISAPFRGIWIAEKIITSLPSHFTQMIRIREGGSASIQISR
jgi:hypothetical protein